MGILDTIEGMSGQQGAGNNAKVAGGLMQALDEHPGGLLEGDSIGVHLVTLGTSFGLAAMVLATCASTFIW